MFFSYQNSLKEFFLGLEITCNRFFRRFLAKFQSLVISGWVGWKCQAVKMVWVGSKSAKNDENQNKRSGTHRAESESWVSHWPMRELHPKLLSLPRSQPCLNFLAISLRTHSLSFQVPCPPLILSHRQNSWFLLFFYLTQTTLTAWHFHRTHPTPTKLWILAKNCLKIDCTWSQILEIIHSRSFGEKNTLPEVVDS